MSNYILTFLFICHIMLFVCEGCIMEYLSVHDMSEKWNIKERKLTAFCRENRIAGLRRLEKNG